LKLKSELVKFRALESICAEHQLPMAREAEMRDAWVQDLRDRHHGEKEGK